MTLLGFGEPVLYPTAPRPKSGDCAIKKDATASHHCAVYDSFVAFTVGLRKPRTRFPSDSNLLYQKSPNRVKGKKNRQVAILIIPFFPRRGGAERRRGNSWRIAPTHPYPGRVHGHPFPLGRGIYTIYKPYLQSFQRRYFSPMISLPFFQGALRFQTIRTMSPTTIFQ